MTERERWIVYPLLFLALGAALRDKLSEQTITKVIRCQELVVTGEEVAGQEGATLVHIGAVKRTSASSPHLGQIVVNGLIEAQAIQAQEIQAASVNADNYFFHRIPLAPLMRSVPGVSPADQLRLQQMNEAEAQKEKTQAGKAHDADAGDDQPGASVPQKAGDNTAPSNVK